MIDVWRRRAERVGLYMQDGKRTSDMTEEEIESAFDALGREFGMHYIWRREVLAGYKTI